MPRAERPRPQDYGAPCRCLRAPVPPPRVLDAAEIVVDARRVGARFEPGAAEDAQRASIERSRLRVASLVLAQHAEFVQRARQIEIAGAKAPLRVRDGVPSMTIGETYGQDVDRRHTARATS